MPTYEYRCEHCGDFEQNQRITDPPLERCPTCRRKVRRLISNTSFQLKGSGWYVTDYARSGSGSGKDTSKSGDKTSDTKSEAKGETKSETKSDAKSESKSESKPTSSGSSEKSAS
jgi:putative FmdB family regulatory protein